MPMIQIKQKQQGFFHPLKSLVSEHIYGCFRPSVPAMGLGGGSILEQIVKRLCYCCSHRTNHDESFWCGPWEQSVAIQQSVTDMWSSPYRKKEHTVPLGSNFCKSPFMGIQVQHALRKTPDGLKINQFEFLQFFIG